MKTPKITVTAFNEFSNFDALIATLGCAPQEPELDYSRTNQVKMVNTDHHFKHDLDSFLKVLSLTMDEEDLGMFRSSIYKNNGELRKLEGKEVKFAADGFFIFIEF